MTDTKDSKLSLIGSISLGTGVMIGAGMIGIILIIVAERLFMISHTDDEVNMPMGMETMSKEKQ